MVSKSVLRQKNREALEEAASAAAAIHSDNPAVVEKIEALQSVRGRDALHEENAKIVALSELVVAISSSSESSTTNEPQRLEDLDSLNKRRVEALKAKGISDIDILRSREDSELESIQGIGKGTVEKIREEIGYERDED